MRAFERAVENLRPLVETKKWDFCVVWKLGDDPSRFIEWMGCCCAGGYGKHLNVKEERGGEKHLLAFCRDAYIQHPLRTKACQTLAQFPSSMPLYSGIHGEVVLSNQPRWLSHGNTSNSNNEHESMGTQVLIPVVGGLIELFSVKHIPKDQKIIEFMMAQYDISMEQEAMTAHSYTNVSLNDKPLHPLLDENLNYWTAPLNYLSLIPKLQDLPHVSQTSTYPSFEGSSTSSDHASRKVSPDKSIGKYAMCQNPNCNEINSIMPCANHAPEKDNFKARKRTEREQYHSKNLVTERNRRNRIKDGLFTLRSLVPKISKMDRASILGDAVDYMEELQKRVKKLQDELKEMEEEDSKENNAKLAIKELKGVGKTYSPATPHTQGFPSADEQKEAEVQVEVNQIGTNDFLLKFCCEQKRGGFARLMEAMNSLGIQVVDANVTTFNGQVLNILKVEAKKSEVQPKNLKDSLIKLSQCQTVDRKSMKRS